MSRADGFPVVRSEHHAAWCRCPRCTPRTPADSGQPRGCSYAMAGLVAGVLSVATCGAPALVLLFRSW